MRKPHIWMLGDWEQAEFALAVEYLRRVAKLDLLAGHVRGSRPDIILLAASRPGRFSKEEVEILRRRAPRARFVALLGSWCEGEVRSGHPWPGVTRIYAHQWQTRLPRELTTVQTSATRQLRRLIGIATAQYATFAALAAACRSIGQEAVWLPPNRPLPVPRVDTIIYDVQFELAEELARLTSLREQFGRPPAILLLDFPRERDLKLAFQAAAAAVLARPFLVADLAAELQRIMAPLLARVVSAA